jgi:hypothetical protein
LKTRNQGVSPQFPGVLVGPPHVRKCHQMSSKEHSEHIQLGWVVRWVLSTPPGHPTAGRCVRVVPVPPLLLCTRPARARPSIGGQSPTPAPRQLPWSPPRAWRSGRLAALQFSRNPRFAHKAIWPKIEIESNNAPRRRGAAVVLEPRYALWGRAMHPMPCDLLHLPQKLCRGSPSPENFVVICSLFVLMR